MKLCGDFFFGAILKWLLEEQQPWRLLAVVLSINLLLFFTGLIWDQLNPQAETGTP